MSNNGLGRKARDAILARRIPERPPSRVWGGRGLGVACPVCTEMVSEADLGFEVEFTGGPDLPRQGVALHVPCFFAWEAVRLGAGDALPASGSSGNISGCVEDIG